jgi:hypothetical protein
MKMLYTKLTNLRTMPHLLAVFAVALFVFSFVSAVAAEELKTKRADISEVQGTFTLLLSGCTSGSDIDNVAILKREDDGRSFDIAGPYTGEVVVKKGLSGMEALAEADKFLGCSAEVDHTQLAKIMDGEGNIVGFEVKPQYGPERYGMPDAFTSRYTIKGDGVTARIAPTEDEWMHNSGD